jgi:hypothetical protein
MAGRNLNGHFLRAATIVIEQDFTPEKREAIRKQLGKEAENALLTATGKEWCAAEHVAEVYAAIATAWASGEERRAGFFKIGTIIGSEAANTFMRLFMKIVTPAMLFKQFPKVWPKYADFGKFELGVLSSDRFEFTVRDLSPMTYQPLVSSGWTHYMLEAMSRKNIQITTEPESGILEGNTWDMTIKTRWS